ncbi:MAG: vanadium-dependent haloperoxidase [Chloroflexota bacterium]
MKVRSILLAAVLLTAIVPPSVSATAPNAVVAWDQYAVEALGNPATAATPGAGQPANLVAIQMALVQGAVYDAVNSIDGGHKALIDTVAAAPSTASQDAAAATAAHHVLVNIPPALPQVVLDRLNTLYGSSIAAIPDSQAKTDGIAAGAAAAAAMLADRAGDGRFGPFRFSGGTEPGQWRPDLPALGSDPNAWIARMRPFTLKAASQFRPEGPPALTSETYAIQFNEVKALGSLTGSSRNVRQDAMVSFFTESPLPLWHRTMRTMAIDKGLSTAESARLFGMVGVAAGDSIIDCWDNKAYWSNWRPITAIREAANDGNPATTAASGWLPFLPTPPYPDNTSGYNCYTAGALYAAAAYFGTDKLTFTVHSATSNTDRTYTRFSRVLRDTVDVRVYQGLHFRFADAQGAWIGRKVAHWVAQNEFGPAE